jgi:hypothetical protein
VERLDQPPAPNHGGSGGTPWAGHCGTSWSLRLEKHDKWTEGNISLFISIKNERIESLFWVDSCWFGIEALFWVRLSACSLARTPLSSRFSPIQFRNYHFPFITLRIIRACHSIKKRIYELTYHGHRNNRAVTMSIKFMDNHSVKWPLEGNETRPED